MKLEDLPTFAVFTYTPGQGLLNAHRLCVRPGLSGEPLPKTFPSGCPAILWSAGRDTIYGRCDVEDIDLTWADKSDPKYIPCAAMLLLEKTQVRTATKEDLDRAAGYTGMVRYPKDMTKCEVIVDASKAASCTNSQCTKNGLVVEAGPSGKCYCCGSALRRA